MRIEAEANLSALIESTEDLIWSVDPRYRLITFNHAFSQYFEQSFGGPVVPGIGLRELLPPALAVMWPPLFDRALRGEMFRAEYSLVDGRILELIFRPIIVDGITTGVSVFGKDITERVKSESAIKKAEANLTALIESTEDLIWSVDLDYRLITFNRALQQNILNTYGVHIAAGMCFHEVLPPDKAALWPVFYEHVLSQGTFRVEYTRMDGGAMELAFNPIIVDGETTGISIFGKDITEQNKSESALKEAEANLSALIESTGDLIWSVDLDYRLTTFNRALLQNFQEDFGVQLQAGMRFHEVLEPKRAALWQGYYARVLAEGPFRVEYDRNDGGIMELAFNPIIVDGETTGISVFGKEITERKRAESALQEAEKKYRDTFEEALEGIFQTTIDGRALDANPAVARMLGYDSPKDFISSVKNTAHDVWVFPEERARYIRQLEENGTVRGFECQFKRRDGTIIWVVLNTRITYAAGGLTPINEGFIEEITERKKAEMQQRESLDSLQESQVIGGLGSYALDIGTGVWTSSDVLDEIFGIGRSYERTVAGWLAFIHPDDRAMMAAYFVEEVVGKGLNFNKEYRIVRQEDQAVRWVHGLGRLEFSGNGQPVKMCGVIKDITEKKLTEIQLRDSEERYRVAFQTSLDAISISRLEDGKFIDVNQASLQLFGYEREEVIGRTSLELHIWPDLQDRQRFVERIQKESICRNMEFQLCKKNGQRLWVLVSGARIDLDGVPCFLLVVRDISDAKAAAEALLLSETRYRTIFQMNHDAIDICRLEDGRFIEVNEAFVRCTGFPCEEVIGHTAQEIGLWVNPIDRQMLLDELRRNQGSCNFETRYRTKNGDLRWSMLSVATIELDGVPCMLSITHDITDAKASEERLIAAANALRSSEERYRTAFQTNLDAMNINRVDDGSFIDCNQAFLDGSGYTREEILGRNTLELGVWADDRDRKAVLEIIHRDSGCRGLEVQFRKKNGEVFWGELSSSLMEVDGVPCILSITRDLSAAKAAEETIQNLAFYDPLTGLPNRRHLLERLRRPLDAGARGGRSQALLLVDLDHFKTLNDTLGHHTGDLLLQEIARRILACAHEADTVCRLGGDEFVVVLENQSKVAEEAAAQAKAVGAKILAAINQPCMIDDHECSSSASIGIAIFGEGQDSTDEILQQAEIALYQAKAAGRNTMRFFSPALQTAVNDRAAMEEDLRQGIKTNQFLLYYQPQVERGRLTGAEALLRWKHPRRGLVQPNDFIPLAEESRLILPLGDWVLEAACAQIKLWEGRKETAHLSVAVNISALQFRQPEFVEQVLATLSRTGANPGSLRLELTESMLVENLEDIIAKMTELKSHGLRFSLDDFGTGYSSLTYLKRLPLDRLKIDRSFVRDMMVDATSGAIAQTILSLGRALGISVIAEGVETEEQRGYLAGLGCHSFQGFLFSPPLPLGKFEAFLQGFAERGGPG
jgi:diguanylate cyclase (GGDEF)-like protein/PAS domain S-box-containing protein